MGELAFHPFFLISACPLAVCVMSCILHYYLYSSIEHTNHSAGLYFGGTVLPLLLARHLRVWQSQKSPPPYVFAPEIRYLLLHTSEPQAQQVSGRKLQSQRSWRHKRVFSNWQIVKKVCIVWV